MKAGGDRCSIDANVILRYLLRDDPELSPRAKAVIESMEDGKLSVVCDPVILAEVVWVLDSFYKLPRDEVASALEPIVKADGFIVPNKERYVKALEIFASTKAHYGDACACAAAQDECDGNLISFDRKLSSIDGISRMESAGD